MRRTLHNRYLTGSYQNDREAEELVEWLIKGGTVDEIPLDKTHHVMTMMTQMRKNYLIQGKDALAAKLEIFLNELKRGPNRFEIDLPEPPDLIRSRSLAKSRFLDPHMDELKGTSVNLTHHGKNTRDIGSIPRQEVKPVLMSDRALEVSRFNYPTSRKIDTAYDNCVEYSVDSKRLGPKLLHLEDVRRRLEQARADYEKIRQEVYFKRQQYDALEAAAADELDDRIKDEMIVFSSHVPTSLPLEYSKPTNRVLNLKERAEKAARIRGYDEAQSLRNEAVKIEKQQLLRQNELFIRAFKMNRSYMERKMDEKKSCFRDLWKRKKEKVTRDNTEKLRQHRLAIENLERELADAEASVHKEHDRIKRSAGYMNSNNVAAATTTANSR